MLSNFFSAICYCYNQEPEKKTIKLDWASTKSKELPNSNSQINENFDNEFSTFINNSPYNPNMNNSQVSKNFKTESPIKKLLNNNQSCKANVKIKGSIYGIDDKKGKLYKKNKSEQYFDDNTYFNNFLLKIDNIIEENLKRQTISESDDIDV